MSGIASAPRVTIAEPTPTQAAPAESISTASVPVSTPPVPMIGMDTAAGDLVDAPQRNRFQRGSRDPSAAVRQDRGPGSASTSMPGIVLMAVIPSAPASSTARAISPMSGTFGDSFTKQGMAWMTSPAA